MLLRHLAQMMTLGHKRKSNAWSNTVTAMEPNTRTPQRSVKLWKPTKNGSRQPCATQRIAKLLRGAASESTEHLTRGEGQGRSPTQSRLLPHPNHEVSSNSYARKTLAAAHNPQPTTTAMVQRSTPTSTPSITLNCTTARHQRGP